MIKIFNKFFLKNFKYNLRKKLYFWLIFYINTSKNVFFLQKNNVTNND